MGKWYTVEEAATELNLGRTTVYGLVLSGAIGSVQIGRARRVPAEAIDEFKAAKLREASHAAPDAAEHMSCAVHDLRETKSPAHAYAGRRRLRGDAT